MKTFLIKGMVFSTKFHQTFAKVHFLILPFFFLPKFPQKSIQSSGKEGTETYSEPSRTSKIRVFLRK